MKKITFKITLKMGINNSRVDKVSAGSRLIQEVRQTHEVTNKYETHYGVYSDHKCSSSHKISISFNKNDMSAPLAVTLESISRFAIRFKFSFLFI